MDMSEVEDCHLEEPKAKSGSSLQDPGPLSSSMNPLASRGSSSSKDVRSSSMDIPSSSTASSSRFSRRLAAKKEAEKSGICIPKVAGNVFKERSIHWTTLEQSNLLAALKRHGSRRLDLLAEAVPERSKENLKEFLFKLKQRHNYLMVAPEAVELYKNETTPGAAAAAAAAVATVATAIVPPPLSPLTTPPTAMDKKPILIKRPKDTNIETWYVSLEAKRLCFLYVLLKSMMFRFSLFLGLTLPSEDREKHRLL